jgi:hypothetical protein
MPTDPTHHDRLSLYQDVAESLRAEVRDPINAGLVARWKALWAEAWEDVDRLLALVDEDRPRGGQASQPTFPSWGRER